MDTRSQFLYLTVHTLRSGLSLGYWDRKDFYEMLDYRAGYLNLSWVNLELKSTVNVTRATIIEDFGHTSALCLTLCAIKTSIEKLLKDLREVISKVIPGYQLWRPLVS